MHRSSCLAVIVIALAACAREPSTPAADAGTATVAASTSNVLTDPASGATCAGHDVRITRDGFNTIVNGDCGTVTITASNGSINVARAREIVVEGNHVEVLNQQVATLESSGADNNFLMTEVGSATLHDRSTVMGRKVDSVRFTGSGNSVSVDNQPKVDDGGTGNSVI